MTAVQPIAGPAGSNGTGGLGVDVWTSQGSPGSVTDWGAIINTLIANGNHLLNFSDHDFPFTTQIDLKGKVGITFQGVSGTVYPSTQSSVSQARSRLIWKGAAGSGVAIQMGISGNGADGIQFRDIGIYYDSTAYNGDLVKFGTVTGAGQTAHSFFTRCQLGFLNNGATTTARSLLAMVGAVSCTVEGCSLWGAVDCIRGYETSPDVSDNNRLIDNTYGNATHAFVCNVGRYWTIDGETFNFGGFGGAGTPTAIGCDINSSLTVFTIANSQAWDPLGGTQYFCHQTAGSNWHITAYRNFIGLRAGFQLDGPGRVNIYDNTWDIQILIGNPSPVDLGSSVTALKDYARVHNNDFSIQGGGPVAVANTSGHKHLDIVALPQMVDVAQVGGYERIALNSLPVASNVAAASGGVTIYGSDAAGIIVVGNTTGAGLTAGKVCDITLGTTPVIAPRTVNGGSAPIQVLLTPMKVGATNITDTLTANAYVSITGVTANNAFALNTSGNVGAGTSMAWAYRVIQL